MQIKVKGFTLKWSFLIVRRVPSNSPKSTRLNLITLGTAVWDLNMSGHEFEYLSFTVLPWNTVLVTVHDSGLKKAECVLAGCERLAGHHLYLLHRSNPIKDFLNNVIHIIVWIQSSEKKKLKSSSWKGYISIKNQRLLPHSEKVSELNNSNFPKKVL